VKILGLDTGAQVLILQGLSTYTALASAYFFALPALREQPLKAHRGLLEVLESSDPDVSKLITEASNILATRSQLDQPLARWHNFLGIILLVTSFLIFTGAIILQVYTDPLFH
jgi:hypothetical protein